MWHPWLFCKFAVYIFYAVIRLECLWCSRCYFDVIMYISRNTDIVHMQADWDYIHRALTFIVVIHVDQKSLQSIGQSSGFYRGCRRGIYVVHRLMIFLWCLCLLNAMITNSWQRRRLFVMTAAVLLIVVSSNPNLDTNHNQTHATFILSYARR